MSIFLKHSYLIPPGTISFYFEKYDLYYMRMTKCASESITHWFKCHIEDIKPINWKETSNKSSGVGEYWYNSLTSIRNPFDRLVSSYKFFLKRKQIPPIMQVAGLDHVEFSEYVNRVIEVGHPEGLTDRDDIKEFFYRQKIDPSLDNWEYILRLHTVPLTHSFCDARKFTEILKFENLENDWELFLNKYGLPNSPLEHANKVGGEVYWNYYDRKTRDIVTDYYKEDLLTFGYNF